MMLKLKFTDCRSDCMHHIDKKKVQNYGQLREGIAALVEEGLSFYLSLNNGKDHIKADDATTLNDLGLNNRRVLTVVICFSARVLDQFSTKGFRSFSRASYMGRITFCRESKPGEIPTTLEDLYFSEPVGSKFDALVVVIHRLMSEVGFAEVGINKSKSLLSNWLVTDDVYKMRYRDPAYISGVCQLICVVLGRNTLMVTALIYVGYSSDTAISMSLNCNKYIKYFLYTLEPRNLYINLPKLSKCFKDTIALPLMNIMRKDAGLPPKSDFMSLPVMVKLLILTYLKGPNLAKLSQVCTELNQLCNDNTVWKKCCKREMRKFVITFKETPETNWKQEYIKRHNLPESCQSYTSITHAQRRNAISRHYNRRANF